jgi:hypothetical protein
MEAERYEPAKEIVETVREAQAERREEELPFPVSWILVFLGVLVGALASRFLAEIVLKRRLRRAEEEARCPVCVLRADKPISPRDWERLRREWIERTGCGVMVLPYGIHVEPSGSLICLIGGITSFVCVLLIVRCALAHLDTHSLDREKKEASNLLYRHRRPWVALVLAGLMVFIAGVEIYQRAGDLSRTRGPRGGGKEWAVTHYRRIVLLGENGKERKELVGSQYVISA